MIQGNNPISSRHGITTSTTGEPASLEKTYAAVNRMLEDGIIESYAIGGAMAVAFYMEPDSTFDVDIFCIVKGMSDQALNILKPIYEYCGAKGYESRHEGILIEGFEVQFLPVFDELSEEAVREAAVPTYGNTPVRVMQPEHLVAIMLKTGRPKDEARIVRFIDAGAFDPAKLDVILSRHGLDAKREVLGELLRRLDI